MNEWAFIFIIMAIILLFVLTMSGHKVNTYVDLYLLLLTFMLAFIAMFLICFQLDLNLFSLN